MVNEATLRGALAHCLDATDFPALGAEIRGQSQRQLHARRRAVHRRDRPDQRVRPRPRHDALQGPGAQPSGRLVVRADQGRRGQSHALRCRTPTCSSCVECTPILVEMVVRAYATGTTSTSLWTHYERGVRDLLRPQAPRRAEEAPKAPEPILTPTTKAPKGEHDVSGSREEILATGHVTAKDFDEAADVAMKLFAAGQRIVRRARASSWSTRSTSSGARRRASSSSSTRSTRPTRRASGSAATYDERFRAGQDPEPLDKDFVRRWYIGAGLQGRRRRRRPMTDDVRVGAAERYIAAYEQITGPGLRPGHATAARAHREEPGPGRVAMKATVIVRLKTEVLDPQGDAVRRALGKLGFEGVKDVRIGKIIEIEIDDAQARGPDLSRPPGQDGRRDAREPRDRGLRDQALSPKSISAWA